MAAYRSSYLVLLPASLLAAIWLSAPQASACSFSFCAGAVVFPTQGEVPADLFMLRYRPAQEHRSGQTATVSSPRLYRISGDTRVEVVLELEPQGEGAFVLQPKEALPVGTQLALEAEPPVCAPGKGLSTQFTLTAVRARPTKLGVLSASTARLALQVAAHASCDDVVDASFADLTLSLAPEAQPFADLIRYQLLLDGAPHPSFADSLGTSAEYRSTLDTSSLTLGRGHDRVYAVCRLPSSRVKPWSASTAGLHRASMQGTLPDGTVLETPEVEFELRCDGPGPDAGWEDLGLGLRDPPVVSDAAPAPASALPDAGAVSAEDVATDALASEDGCTLATKGKRGAPRSWPGLLVALLLLGVWRRSRRTALSRTSRASSYP